MHWQCPSHKSILLIEGPIHEIFTKNVNHSAQCSKELQAELRGPYLRLAGFLKRLKLDPISLLNLSFFLHKNACCQNLLFLRMGYFLFIPYQIMIHFCCVFVSVTPICNYSYTIDMIHISGSSWDIPDRILVISLKETSRDLQKSQNFDITNTYVLYVARKTEGNSF